MYDLISLLQHIGRSFCCIEHVYISVCMFENKFTAYYVPFCKLHVGNRLGGEWVMVVSGHKPLNLVETCTKCCNISYIC